jgi:Arc/MetJ family transcription regulator
MTESAKILYEMLQAEEIDEATVQDTIEALGVKDKLEDYCKVIRQFEADAEMLKAEKGRIEAKQKRAENGVARLKNVVLQYMSITGSEKEDCGIFEIKRKQSKAVDIINENLIPAEYRVAQPDKINKAEIRKALLNGEQIEGAAIQINESINIK